MKIELKADKRSVQGTGASRRLRRESKVPGVLYGAGKDALPIEVDHKDLWFKLKMEAFHASILDLEVGSEKSQVLLRDYQMHPFRPQILHADFQRVDANKKIHMRVPLHFIGQENSPAVKVTGGLISHVLSAIDVACLPKDLPEFIEVDLSDMNANQTVRVLDLKLPTGVTPVLKGKENPVVASVTTHGETTEEEAAAAPAAAEVPATAQKAPVATAAEPAKGGKEKGGDKKK